MHPSVAKMAIWAEAWTRAAAVNRRDRGTFLILAGPPGTGKTHVCRRVTRFLRDYAIEFWLSNLWASRSSVPAVQYAVFSRIAGLERREWEDWLEDAAAAAWIVLDDVGSEVDRYRTGEPAERLRRVLDLGASRFMLISTNVVGPKWKVAFDARAADRMSAGECVDLSGVPSYRSRGRL